MSRTDQQTDMGEQTLIDGVRPITLRDRLSLMATQPMTPKRSPGASQKPCDHCLFDEVGRTQLDLVDLIAPSQPETDL